MKKALLTLTMVCALPISSLNAGLSNWMPSSWTKEASAETKQAHVDSAKGYGWGTALALGSTALFLAATLKTSPATLTGPILQFCKKDAMLLINPIEVVSLTLINAGVIFPKFVKPGVYGNFAQVSAPLGLLVSEVATLACAAKVGYDWLQAQRIQLKDES